ncbi:MAG: hypothetical protein PF481_08795, partial [Bacteroidales bacterium]|nr:hypothetical protein [Bacteroidales bacterium]
MKTRRFLLVFITAVMSVISAFSQRDLVISGGNSVSSFVCNNRKVYTWGNNSTTEQGTGLLGTGGTANLYSTPQAVTFPINPDTGTEYDIKQVNSGSGSHFVALDCYNEVWSWGNNSKGQVGNGTALGSGGFVDAPTKVLASAEIAASHKNASGELINAAVVYAGNNSSFSILDDGRLVSWGGNNNGFSPPYDDCFGQLGNGNQIDQTRAVYVRTSDGNPLEGVVQVFAGDNGAYALVDPDGDGVGTMYSWGYGQYGVLGRNIAGTGNPASGDALIDPWARPVFYADNTIMDNVTDIMCGDVFAGALDVDGYVWTWGNGGWNNSTGNTTTNYTGSDPRRVLAGTTTGASNDGTYLLAKAIGGGQGYGMAVTVDGKPVAWGGGGCGDGGATGNGTTAGSSGVTEYIQFAPGAVHDDVILINRGDTWGFYGRADGSMWAWGCNEVGQLGLNSTTGASYASKINPPTGCGFPAPRPFVALTPGDITVCESDFLAGPGIDLNSGFQVETSATVNETDYEIRWYRGGSLVFSGTALNALEYAATQPGTYRVEIEYTGTNTGCEPYDIEFGEMTIDVWLQTYSIPSLIYCEDSSDVHVNATVDAVYSWYPTETSTQLLGMSNGSDDVRISINDAESGSGTDKIVYVEESAYASGSVLRKSQGCDPTWFSGDLNLNNGTINQDNSFATGFTVTEEITIEELSFMFRSSIYTVGNSGTATITMGVYGSRMNNGGYVADNNNLIGTLVADYERTRDASEVQDLDVQLTATGSVVLQPGTYFMGVRAYSGTGLNNPKVGRGNCTLSSGIVDNVTGDIIRQDIGVSGYGNPDQTNSGFVFDIQFKTAQHFCDRIPVTLIQDCPCISPVAFTIESTDTDLYLCTGETTTLSPSVNQVNMTDFDFTWYEGTHTGGSIVDGPTDGINSLDYDVSYLNAGE